MGRDDLREVLLVDDDPDAGAARAGPAGPARPPGPEDARRAGARPAGARPSWWRLARAVGSRRRRTVPVAVIATVVAALVGTTVVGDMRDRRRTTELADVAGLVAPLGPTLAERWRAPAAGARTATPGGALLVTTRDERRGAVVARVDPRTGERGWTATLPELGATGSVACLAVTGPPDGRDAHVVCTVTSALTSFGFGRRRVATDGRTVLAVLDAGSGTRVATHDLGRRLPSLDDLGPDVVLAEVDADGHVRVARQDPVTGAVRWAFRSPDRLGGLTALTPLVLGAPEAAGRTADADPADLAEVVAVSGPGAWALRPDGSLLGAWSPRRPGSPVDVDPSVELTVLPDGRFVVGEPDPGGLDDSPYGTVSASDARDGFGVPGRVLRPVVDDGSADDALLTVPPGSGQVVAVDRTTGRWHWRADSRGATVVLDGRLHTRSGRAVTAIDVGTGRTVWRAEVPSRRAGRAGREMLTDGRVLLVPTTSADGRPALTALALDDGRVRWSVPAPEGVEDLLVVDGHLVGLTEGEAVGLG